MWPSVSVSSTASGDSCCYSFGAGGFKTRLEEMLPGLYVKSLQFGNTPEMVIKSVTLFCLSSLLQIFSLRTRSTVSFSM